jgi:hypothetical protein
LKAEVINMGQKPIDLLLMGSALALALILAAFGGMAAIMVLGRKERRANPREEEAEPRPRLPLTLPPSPLLLFGQPIIREWREELRKVRDPFLRVAVGWPLFLWRVWDFYKFQWLIRRILKDLKRSQRRWEKQMQELREALYRAGEKLAEALRRAEAEADRGGRGPEAWRGNGPPPPSLQGSPHRGKGGGSKLDDGG